MTFCITQQEGGEEMIIELATWLTGISIIVGACIAGGIVSAGLQKLADTLNKQR